MSDRDDFRLDGRVALVSGGASGIGLECARALTLAGCSVMLSDLRDTEGQAVTDDINAAGGNAAYTHLDVTREDQWVRAIDETLALFGGLDVLVNNAGIEIVAPLVDTLHADFRKVMCVNVDGVFLGCKHAVSAMRPGGKAGRGGSIVNLSSIAGKRGVSFLSAYGTSKGAVKLLTKDVAIECAQLGYGIRCNSVHPGVVLTGMADGFFEQHKALGVADTIQGVQAAFEAAHPMGHFGTTRDVANAVRFLASPASAWITGAELSVDGGWAAR